MYNENKHIYLQEATFHPDINRENAILKKGISRFSFSIAILVVLLHKYSSYLFETVFLRIRFSKPGYPKIIELKYSLSDNQTFLSVCRQVEKDVGSVLSEYDSACEFEANIQWIIGAEEKKTKYSYEVRLSIHSNFYEVHFFSASTAFFKPVFEIAERHFHTLAENALSSPQTLISEIGYLSEGEFEKIEALAYGPVKKRISQPELLHTLFEQTAAYFPGQTAIFYNDVSLSYNDLNGEANRLAHFLIKQGIKTGDVIGILLSRKPEVYVAMLGILKAGAAYLPLDGAFPEERIDYILKDSKAKFLISDSSFGDLYSHFAGTILNTDKELLLLFSDSTYCHNPNVAVEPKSPAYIIYTSGTTGKPKGVIVSHASASHLVKAEKTIFKLSPEDKVLQGLSIAFDASIEEIWLAFESGAALVPASEDVMHSGDDLSEFIRQQKISVLSTVPTMLSMMQPPLPSLKILILGGENCPDELLKRWGTDGLRIVNTYGPTEATVITTCAEYHEGEKINIGKPIPNYAVFITDPALNPVPEGVPGELCIAGMGLATGYLHGNGLNDEKFIKPPFPINHEFPKRMYRTGDLARFNEKGELEFLGRIDSQVKLRGYRIELSEIESQLLKFGNIKNAAVAVKEDKNKDQWLVAYLILNDDSINFDEVACKNFLQTKLASYMVPSMFMLVKDLPTLPSGKVDRKQLPDPEQNTINESKTRLLVEPRNVIEKKIHEVWRKYFTPHSVSVTDDFFLDLGGHSLLAAQVVSELRLQDDFHNLSVLDIYHQPTIEKLSATFMSTPKASQKQEKSNSAGFSRYYPSSLVHFCCGVMQFLSFYFVFGFRAFLDITPYLVLFYLLDNGYSVMQSVTYAVITGMFVYPVSVIIAIVLKWTLIGRIREGRHHLWGWYYLRWWFIQNIIQALHLDYLSGTPILPFVYRLFGMKIGKDVHLETDRFASFDLIHIGDGSSIDEEASLLGYAIRNGELIITPIHIGSRCFIGARSVIRGNTVMEDGARLEDLSLLVQNMKVPQGETWAGSPLQRMTATNRIIPPPERGPLRKIITTVLYVSLIFIIPLIFILAFVPGIVLLMQLDPFTQPLFYLLMLPVIGASFVLLLTAEVAMLKWLLVGRVKAGTYPVHGGFYIRNWIVDQLLKMSLDHIAQLHATLYVLPWYRLLGAKLGRFVELSTATSTTPDLLEIKDGGTVADESSLGSPRVEGGWITVAQTRLGNRSFIGNSAVVPAGSVIGDGSLIGVLSIPPKHDDAAKTNATWLGSPPVYLPHRQPSDAYSDERTYKPDRKLWLARGAFEILRNTFPPAGFILVTVSVVLAALHLTDYLGLGAVILLIPVLFAASCIAVLLVVALVKWVVMGRYQPFMRPLWTPFVWRLEFVNALYEFLATPLVLQSLQGTPFLSWYLRLLGAKIGRACYIDTTGFLEWDLVEIGDGAILEEDCIMQTHLFEDRVLKASRLRIGDHCEIGTASVVLYDSMMKDGSKLDALSLIMKGETIPPNTEWAGIPAKFVQS